MHTREQGLPARPRVQFMTSQQSNPKWRVKERRLTLATGMPPPNDFHWHHRQDQGILSRRASAIVKEQQDMEESFVEQDVRLVFAKPLAKGKLSRFPWCWPKRV